ncbi:hypothetical protein SAMN04487898_11549 [Pedobacter sp. ok626]|uniref:hypothetical protein n=1 Tax=Pedobacter sp. ok626 TaxID=1761882 RepID=UPI00087EAA6D|nr:hypothetical protein [Pedobacter sp. ok626]SDL11812.1 hypothetical protein SAMN04487898_11549 [Pedobacter sp. ok626]
MTPIEYLKLQAKNLHKDFKTQTSSFDPKLRRNVYEYDPKFFKIDLLLNDFNINEEKFKLGNAHHVIAKLCGLNKWTDLLKASPAKIELSILLNTNMDKVEVRDWDEYVSRIETENKVKLDDEFKLQIFTEVFLEGEQDIYYDDYRLSKDEDTEIEWEKDEPVPSVPSAKISSLSLTKEDREEFIKAANHSFERIFERIEPDNPELTRSLWNAERYIDEQLLRPDRLPIDRDYALSLIESSLVGYVIQLAAQADDQAGQPN